MKVILKSLHYGNKNEDEYNNIKEAAEAGWYQIEYNTAMPVKIVENGTIIWKNNGPSSEPSSQLAVLAEMKGAE